MSHHIVRQAGNAPGTDDAESPGWWRDRLLARIAADAPGLKLIEDYVSGRHRLSFATSKYREAFGRLMAPLRDDWISVVAEAPVERLIVDGFTFGADDESGDNAAWSIWQDNGLDARAAMAHDEAIKYGRAFVSIGAPDGGEAPGMLVLPPTRAAIERDPSRPMHRVAGLHTWREIDGSERARLWSPDGYWEWASDGAMVRSWELVERGGNPIRVVPIVALVNRPTLRHPDGQSDVMPVIPVQDAINKLLADMMVAGEFAAFRQRWATGIEIPTDPETGEPLNDQFVTGVSRLLTVAEADTKFGEFSASDLSNYTGPIEMLVQHIAAQTRTPAHYLMGQLVNISAEALRAAETGLVSRVRNKQITIGEGWEEAMRIAFAWQGDTERAARSSCEVIWRDPETRTEGERTDALVKLASLGLPSEWLWARIPGVTPQEIAHMRAMAEREAVTRGLTLGVTPNGAPIDEDTGAAPGGQ